jgi:hypothetical protein
MKHSSTEWAVGTSSRSPSSSTALRTGQGRRRRQAGRRCDEECRLPARGSKGRSHLTPQPAALLLHTPPPPVELTGL